LYYLFTLIYFIFLIITYLLNITLSEIHKKQK
jgi:hypothetical protein